MAEESFARGARLEPFESVPGLKEACEAAL